MKYIQLVIYYSNMTYSHSNCMHYSFITLMSNILFIFYCFLKCLARCIFQKRLGHTVHLAIFLFHLFYTVQMNEYFAMSCNVPVHSSKAEITIFASITGTGIHLMNPNGNTFVSILYFKILIHFMFKIGHSSA